MASTPHDLPSWVDFLSHAEIPVLKHSAREINHLQADEEAVTARGLTNIVNHDPLMAFRVLRYMQNHKRKNQLQDLVLVEQAIMMMGITTFFRDLAPQPLVEAVLKTNLPALTQLLRLINRANRAAHYAFEWGVMLRDLHVDEVRVAALLHDLAEVLMWCFAPEQMTLIHDKQLADKNLRSHQVQQEVFGFKLSDLQLRLIEVCQLPPLLAKLMNDSTCSEQQVKNVALAVNLARHSANGWQDAALPDDYRDIADLLRIDTAKAMQIVGAKPEITAV
ncbi:MAG: HDOD domain-containing protein [Methylophilaceae bacterium]|nr:HDOD domain-containing protein [Methylophilaceae bacterium]